MSNQAVWTAGVATGSIAPVGFAMGSVIDPRRGWPVPQNWSPPPLGSGGTTSRWCQEGFLAVDVDPGHPGGDTTMTLSFHPTQPPGSPSQPPYDTVRLVRPRAELLA